MTKAKASIFFGVAAVAVVVGGMVAFACTNLATLGTGTTSGKAGTAVTVTGTSFAATAAGEAPSPVSIRWNGVDGPVLAQLAPDAAGGVSGTFELPADADPGHYVVVATQVDAEGEPQFGTPARVAFEVVGPNGETAPVPAVQAADSSPTGSRSSESTIAVLALGVLAVGLFAAGCASYLQGGRKSPTPARRPAERG